MDVVFDELHRRVTSYLATVKNVAADGGDDAALVIARSELPLIVDAFDALFGGTPRTRTDFAASVAALAGGGDGVGCRAGCSYKPRSLCFIPPATAATP
ncbi:hypothetical protein C8D87_110239 [Lentzea atacamensis]|uniref:Uncharacterized protein n=1 Tax=Lentzea atacamensis TaxID=531938 RepID=A0ABX9DZL6_9PSEU|nr:hypothetical protein [Lentzea atacamensis]RAS61291.1 hypothetical protein C8D87_110239 [Lentzea atacamensis]